LSLIPSVLLPRAVPRQNPDSSLAVPGTEAPIDYKKIAMYAALAVVGLQVLRMVMRK
jgi:hypothetical protein